MAKSAFVLDHIVPIVQPTDNTCGQACVAMVAGVSVDEVIKHMGVARGSFESEIRNGLKTFGFRSGREREIPYEDDRSPRFRYPKCGIANITWHGPTSRVDHAVLLNDGVIYDPALGAGIPIANYVEQIIVPLRRYMDGIIVITGRVNKPDNYAPFSPGQ